ncbi:MAG: glutamine--tRNA ligase [Opitutaceae bacterium]
MSAESPASGAPAAPTDFIRDLVAADVAAGRHARIITRFPPEPNGYLHIGHAKSICLNFGLAREHGGTCHLRFDDTNPAKEDIEYVEAISRDVQWLIAGWADHCLGLKPRGATPAAAPGSGTPDYHLAAAPAGAGEREAFFASDYFEALHAYAVELIRRGKAYVCDLTPEETDAYRGAPDQPGRDSPYRNRTVAENLDLFARMRAGEFPNGARSLRARIDMASPNVWLRDPLLYRIRHTAHHHAGNRWCIYPLYDFAHCLSDYIEGITHSVCTLEFEVHRPLYDWILQSLDLPRPLPHQYEFAKLNISYLVFSKRRLLQLVEDKLVAGWDDPRMPTLSGARRRGIPAAAIRRLASLVGVTKYDSLTDLALFEHAIREELNPLALRRLAVLRPLKIVLTNLAPGEEIPCTATNNPQDPAPTTRPLALTRELFIEAEDFAEVPPPKFFRLKPGGEVRLKYACIISCQEVIKDAAGQVTELRCTADLTTRSGQPNADRKVKGTLHWVSATHGVPAEVRLYDRLFTVPEPAASGDFRDHVNPRSLETVTAVVEPALAAAQPGDYYQFERLGYFVPDSKDRTSGRPVFNRTLTLKDAWAPKGPARP